MFSHADIRLIKHYYHVNTFPTERLDELCVPIQQHKTLGDRVGGREYIHQYRHIDIVFLKEDSNSEVCGVKRERFS